MKNISHTKPNNLPFPSISQTTVVTGDATMTEKAKQQRGGGGGFAFSFPVTVVISSIAYIYISTVFVFIDRWFGLFSSPGIINAVVFTVIAFMCVFCYRLAIFTDPGRVPSTYTPDVEDNTIPIHEIKRKVITMIQFCYKNWKFCICYKYWVFDNFVILSSYCLFCFNLDFSYLNWGLEN